MLFAVDLEILQFRIQSVVGPLLARVNWKTAAMLGVCGYSIMSVLYPDAARAYTPFSGYDDGLFKQACSGIKTYQDGEGEDGLGALLTAVAGTGAIVAAATGAFRMAWGLLVVSIGTYLLGDWVNVVWFKGKC